MENGFRGSCICQEIMKIDCVKQLPYLNIYTFFSFNLSLFLFLTILLFSLSLSLFLSLPLSLYSMKYINKKGKKKKKKATVVSFLLPKTFYLNVSLFSLGRKIKAPPADTDLTDPEAGSLRRFRSDVTLLFDYT